MIELEDVVDLSEGMADGHLEIQDHHHHHHHQYGGVSHPLLERETYTYPVVGQGTTDDGSIALGLQAAQCQGLQCADNVTDPGP